MPTFISMKSTTSGQVDITLNLSSYIDAYEKAYGSQREAGGNQADAIVKFKKLTVNISEQLTGLIGQIHWFDALGLATEGLEPSQQDAVAQSPAARMMDNSFIEIIKNSMDEVISMHYDSTTRTAPIIQLTLNIDHASHPDQVSIQITDSGRGFPHDFLDKVSTPTRRAAYVNTSNGSNKTTHCDRPPLFGGQGRGLRILIADEDGDVLEHSGQRTHRFIKPEISSVEFDNLVDENGYVLGAQITVITSIEPRKECIAEQMHTSRHACVTLSPSNSDTTTHEAANSASSSPRFSLSFLSGLNFNTENSQINDDNFETDKRTSPGK